MKGNKRPLTRDDLQRLHDLREMVRTLESVEADQMLELHEALSKAGLMPAGPPPPPGSGPGQWLARVAAHAEIIRDALEPWDSLTRPADTTE